MKKLLALVLALVMTLSLCVTSNAAYADAADVDYTEAVDVMSAVGVFQGADGKFSPKAELTREQAAKLIAYLDLGEKTAEALPAVKVFNDVEANRWSAKYIAYCADAGYLAGVGDNNFDPAGKLTGYAFGKMLLCVLGYDAAIEGFTGANWQIAVAKLMNKADLAKGVAGVASATLTREAAAQYCLNALKTTMVEYYNKGTNVTINGAVISTGASAATPMVDKSEAADNIVADDYLQLGEKLFKSPALKLDTKKSDDFGRKQNTWTYNKETVKALSGAADYTFTGAVKGSDLLSALGLKSSDKLIIAEGKITKSDEGKVTKSSKNVFKSVNAVVEVNEVKTEGVVTGWEYTVVEYKLGYVQSVTAAKNDKEAYVTIYSGCDTDKGSKIGTFETTKFEKKDVVLYTYANSKIQSVQLAESVEGKVTKLDGTKATIDGTVYDSIEGAAVAIKDEGTFYLGVDNVIMGKVAKSDSSDEYAYVYKVTESDKAVDDNGIDVSKKLTAYYVKADGTNGKAVVYSKDANIKNKEFTGTVSYLINADGEFKTVKTIENTTETIDKNVTKTSGGKYLTSETNFVFVSLKNSDGDDKLVITSATGYKNVDIKSATAYVVANKDAKATTVFVAALEKGIDTDKTYAFLKSTSAVKIYEGDKVYYEFKVVIDGEETTLRTSDENIFGTAKVAENELFTYTLKDGKLSTVAKVEAAGTKAEVVGIIDSYLALKGKDTVNMADTYIIYNNTDADDMYATDTLEKGDIVTYYTKTVNDKTVVNFVVITTNAEDVVEPE